MPPAARADGSRRATRSAGSRKILWCPGRTAEARADGPRGGRAPRGAAAGPRAGMAYANLAILCWPRHAPEEAVRLGQPRARACRAARGHRDRASMRTITIGVMRPGRSAASGSSRASSSPGRPGSPSRSARAFYICSSRRQSRPPPRSSRLATSKPGIDYCSDHGLELRSALPARLSRAPGARPGPLGGGGRDRRSASFGLHRTSITPRIVALVVLGARAGAARRPGTVAAARRGVGAGRADRGAAATGAGRGGESRGSMARRRPRRRRRGDRRRCFELRVERRLGRGWPASCLLAPARRRRRARSPPGSPSRTRSSSPATGARPPSLARARLPVRGRARAGRRGRGGAAAAGARRAAAAGGAAGGGDRRPAAARARRARAAARSAADDAARIPANLTARELEVLALVAAGSAERPDRRAARSLQEHRRPPRLGDPAQARASARAARRARRPSGSGSPAKIASALRQPG